MHIKKTQVHGGVVKCRSWSYCASSLNLGGKNIFAILYGTSKVWICVMRKIKTQIRSLLNYRKKKIRNFRMKPRVTDFVNCI